MNCFAYIRVSTTKQRDQGASLEAQEDAIQRYAHQHGLVVTRWFRETKTAATTGRGVFTNLLRLLKAGEAQGAIVHKIDRSARNLTDWSEFISLMDYGVQIHIASENLDLTSRGGRLSADIQAVVAADYIRNLRLEALKGIRARYQQGVLPARAPLGYRDQGSGKVKTIDPVSGPLVRELFERYATGRYSLDTIRLTMVQWGLKNLRGKTLSINSVSGILNNPYYYGLLRIRATGETFQGKHQPLISRRLYEACADIREGRTKHRAVRSPHIYSRLVTCALCGYSLVAERQKGHVYYRCHTKTCPLKSKREEEIEAAIAGRLKVMRLSAEERAEIEAVIENILGTKTDRAAEVKVSLSLQLKEAEARLERLADLLLDGVISRATYQKKQRALQERALELRKQLTAPEVEASQIRQRIQKYLELAETAWLSYEQGKMPRKRQMVETVTSNLTTNLNHVAVELRSPFQSLSARWEGVYGGPQRDEPRTPEACSERQVATTCLAESLIQVAKVELAEADHIESG